MIKHLKANISKYFVYCTVLIINVMAITIYAEMRIVLTAALTDNHFEFRKNQYIESLNILANFGYPNPYIVEAIRTPGPTFLDDYSTHVFYATCNNPSAINQGVNEAHTLLEALEHFQFDDDDMILKITGRYQLMSDRLIKIVEKNQSDFDAFIMVPTEEKAIVITDEEILKTDRQSLAQGMARWKKKGVTLKGETPVTTTLLQRVYNAIEPHDEFWGRVTDPQKQIITHQSVYCLAIAMKCKYFKEMLRSLNYPRLEHPKDWVALEKEIEEYIKRKISEKNFNIFYLDKLDIWANLFGSTSVPGHPAVIRIY